MSTWPESVENVAAFLRAAGAEARLEEFDAETATAADAARAVGAEASYACTLALEEVVTNVFKYAYDDSGAHAVRFTAQLTPDHVVLRFSDDGRPFDPLAAPPPDLARPLEERAIGGLGIHLVRKLADALVYERSGDRNLLTARFALRPKAPVN